MHDPYISRRLHSFLIGFWCILVSDILERVAFFAFLGGIVVFLNGEPLRWTEINALYLAFIFIGITYCSAFFGSLIADMFLGNFKTICLGYVVYIAGYAYWLVLVTHLSQLDIAKIPAMCSGATRNHSSGPELRMNIGENAKYFSAIYLGEHPVELNTSQDIGNTTFYNMTTILGPAKLLRRWMDWEKCSWPIVFIICLISIGSGMVRTNIARFGADHQVEFQAIKEAALGGHFMNRKVGIAWNHVHIT
jgi:dipeptide/tripeptide permease